MFGRKKKPLDKDIIRALLVGALAPSKCNEQTVSKILQLGSERVNYNVTHLRRKFADPSAASSVSGTKLDLLTLQLLSVMANDGFNLESLQFDEQGRLSVAKYDGKVFSFTGEGEVPSGINTGLSVDHGVIKGVASEQDYTALIASFMALEVNGRKV